MDDRLRAKHHATAGAQPNDEERQRMDKPTATSRAEQWMEKRIERKGLRPRDAAYMIAAFWTAAVVVFGVLERIIDPKTFHSVWLGMWWAVETVTTVGYGDVIPSQAAGKVIATFLMLGGLSLLAVFTAAITSGFVSRAQAQAARPAVAEDQLMQKLAELSLQVEAVKDELGRLRPATEN
jgi:voltage-gated potassium channel